MRNFSHLLQDGTFVPFSTFLIKFRSNFGISANLASIDFAISAKFLLEIVTDSICNDKSSDMNFLNYFEEKLGNLDFT